MDKSIAVFGTVFMDIKGFSHKEYSPLGTNIGDIVFSYGGVGRNVAVNIANIGLPVKFVSTIDKGSTGDEIISNLNACGIDTEFVLRTDKDGIGMWMAVLNESGELMGSISKQPDFTALKMHIDNIIDEVVDNCSCVVLEMDITEEIAETVVLKAAKANVPVYVIVGNMSVILKRKDLLSMTKCFICNNIEAGKLIDSDFTEITSDELHKRIKDISNSCDIKALVITNGAEGAVYYDSEKQCTGIVPAINTEVVDTTGAGDAFFSGTVGSLSKGKTLDIACRFGARLAAEVISSANSSVGAMHNFFEE